MTSAIGKWVRRFFLVVAALIVLVFSVANRGNLTFSFFPLPYEIEMPKVIFALTCFAIGALFGAVYMSLKNLRLNAVLKQAEQKNAALENEVLSLRSDAAQHLPPVPKLPGLEKAS